MLQFLSANESKKGWFGGLGIGVANSRAYLSRSRDNGLTIPWEIGYGVSENVLIYLSVESSGRIENELVLFESLSGLGLSYYINNDRYIKATIGSSTMKHVNIFQQVVYTGSGFSVGYGETISKKSSIEFSYFSLSLDRMEAVGYIIPIAPMSSNTFSVIYKYRWF